MQIIEPLVNNQKLLYVGNMALAAGRVIKLDKIVLLECEQIEG